MQYPLSHHQRNLPRHRCRCLPRRIIYRGVIHCLICLSIYAEPSSEKRENRLFRALVGMVPNLEERIMTASSEEIKHISDLVRARPLYKAHLN